jgi:hypothetical protein
LKNWGNFGVWGMKIGNVVEATPGCRTYIFFNTSFMIIYGGQVILHPFHH